VSRLRAADLARIAVFAALIAALGLPGTIALFGNAVPITAQTLGVMLAGALLGARRGALACLVFLALVAAGLPLLAGGRGGWAVFTGPSAGYLIGFPVGAFVIGLLTARLLPRYPFWAGLAANLAGGILVVYAIGIPVQAARVGSGLLAVVQGAVQYLPGDLIKVVITTIVAQRVHRAFPGLVGTHRDQDL